MDEQQRKAMLKETFDTVSGGYDNEPLRFFPLSADRMVSLLDLRGDEHVLDVACGTGHTSLCLARRLPQGRVTAVDFSSGMLDQARRKADSHSIRNIDFLERDMTDLRFEAGSFDGAVCAFGIFFVEDMDSQLSHIASVLKPGGRMMISSFQENYFQPLRDMFLNRIADYGIRNQPQAWKGVASKTGCRQLFERAGLSNISVKAKNIGYYLESPEQWWSIVWNAGFRRLVNQLTPEEQLRFKCEHLQDVESLRTDKGIWLDVEVLYTSGTKA